MTSLTEIRARREAHEASLIDARWFSPAQLAKRWGLSATTVRDIPAAELRYKEFGQGAKLKRRRYRLDWVLAYEESSRRIPLLDAEDEAA